MKHEGSASDAKTTSLPRGVFAAALTPMDVDLNPDHGAFADHCRRLLEAGCHGVAVFGTTGEATSFSVDERLAALEALIEESVPAEALLPGTGSSALTDTGPPEPRGAGGGYRGRAGAAALLLQGHRRRRPVPLLRGGRRARG
jgi:hypothetical protein